MSDYKKLIKNYDWKNPHIAPIFRARMERKIRLRAHPQSALQFAALAKVYSKNPLTFVEDWGVTFDPRVIPLGRPALMPFVLFPRQVELFQWTLDRYHNLESGIVEKSRDMGASWIAVAIACWLCIFHRDAVVGFGSRTENMVDKSDDPDSLLFKARAFVKGLPKELRGGWHENNSPHMRVPFSGTGSIIKGDAGKNVGRGGRANLYFVDECCHLENDYSVDFAISGNTPSRIDISSVNGMDNSFAERRHNNSVPVFTLHWKTDPRKDQAYYDKFLKEKGAVVTAQELDIDYGASVEGTIIHADWIAAAVGFAKKYNISIEGIRIGAYDPGDRGKDMNAIVLRQGIEIADADLWSGKRQDLFESVARAFATVDKWGTNRLIYDCAGIGGGTYAGAKTLNKQRKETMQDPIRTILFNAGSAVSYPERGVPGMGKRKNKDHFKNLKAQSYIYLAYRFEQTYKYTKGQPYDANFLISISEDIHPSLLVQLKTELGQPTQSLDGHGKAEVDKLGSGASPNLADAVAMAFSPVPMPLTIPQDLL